jgi:glutathione S-transferase
MLPPNIELISHHLCPFNQRLALILLAKGLKRDHDFQINYVQLGNFPDWFLQLSPQKSMPLVRLDAQDTFFKTTVLGELLDEITTGTLHDSDAKKRAYDRYWIDFAAQPLDTLRLVFTAKTIEDLEKNLATLFNLLTTLETQLSPNQRYWRNKTHFGMVDAAFAPFFTLFFHFKKLREDARLHTLPNVHTLGESLMAQEIVMQSVTLDFDAWFERFFELTGGIFKAYYTESSEDLLFKSERHDFD